MYDDGAIVNDRRGSRIIKDRRAVLIGCKHGAFWRYLLQDFWISYLFNCY